MSRKKVILLRPKLCLPCARPNRRYTVAWVCRKMGIREATYYNWEKKHGGLNVSELRLLK
jgi:putative transposase